MCRYMCRCRIEIEREREKAQTVGSWFFSWRMLIFVCAAVCAAAVREREREIERGENGRLLVRYVHNTSYSDTLLYCCNRTEIQECTPWPTKGEICKLCCNCEYIQRSIAFDATSIRSTSTSILCPSSSLSRPIQGWVHIIVRLVFLLRKC